jgi:sarcosine oxidase subunit gamma
MRPGNVASTVAAHIGVQIWQVDALPSYDLAGPISYAGSLLRALELAGAPVIGN